VHRGRLPDGREVAVKVQYPEVARLVTIDLRNFRVLVRILARIEPQFDFRIIIDEVEKYVPRELDFRQEAANADRMRQALASRRDVVIPAVVHELSTTRLLVMAYEPGVRLTDLDALRQLGLDPKDLARRLVELAGAILPGILPDGFGVSDERVVFGTVASVYALAMVVLNFVMLAKVRERREFMDRPSNPFIPGVRRALRNRPFRVLLLAGVVNAIPASIPAILIPYYTYYAIRPENPASWLAGFLLLYLGAGMLCLPLWMALARRIGKLATMAAASAMGISGSVLFFFVGEGDTSFASCVYGYTGIASGAFLFLIPSMGADTIDYDELRTGRRREAQFGAFWAIIPKFVSIPGASIPIAILSAVGYVPNEVQTPEVVFTIKFLYSLFPATFYVVALAIVLRYPISEAAHAAIRDGIDRHQRGETAVDPFTGERLPAPRTVTAEDEDTGWFLDYFSRGELERVLARGSGRLQFDVWRAFGASVIVLVGALLLAARSVSGLDSEPGPVAVLAVVLGGGALTSALFQAGRIGAASRFVARPVPTPVVQGHVDRLRPGGARA
jgi:hypothetical protein